MSTPQPSTNVYDRHDPIDTSALRHVEPGIRLCDDLARYWEDGVRGDGLPTRSHFDFTNLARWLGFISIYEFVGVRDDFRNRLEGTYIAEMTGENWTGRFASDVDRRFGGNFLQELRNVARARRPLRSRCELFQKDFIRVERVLLPIAGPDDVTHQVFLGMFPLREMPRRFLL